MKVLFVFVMSLLFLPVVYSYGVSDFPAPFVIDGKPQSNLAIVVGDRAAASDVIAALDIGVFLQQSGVKGEYAPFLSEDAVSVGSVSEVVAINKTLGAVRPVFTEVDLDLLKGGLIVTQEGSTEYNQYLRLPQGGPAGVIILAETDGIVGLALAWVANFPLFTWELEFEEGLTSRIEGGKLVDLQDEDVMILGMPFVIVDASYSTVTNRASITFLGGGLSALLGENERETFVLDGKEYEVEVLIISETADDGDGTVKFRINGEITDALEDGETDFLADGTLVAVRDIVSSAKDIQKSIVQFYLGPHVITFFDGNASDDASAPASVLVNLERMTSSSSSIMGSEVESNRTFRLEKINYTLYDENLVSSSFVFPGKTLRSQQEKQEGFLTPVWDLVYLGLAEVGETYVVLDPVADHSYDIQFTNQEGIFYDIPFITNDRTSGNLKFGDDNDDLWFCEPANNTMYQVTDGDFFVLSNCDGPAKDDTCFSHVLRYDSVDTTQNVLSFTDLGMGTRAVVFDNATREAGLVAGGVSYAVFVDPVGPHNVSIDLDGNGVVQGDCAYVGIQGEGMLLFGGNNTNESSLQGSKAFVVGNASNLTVITLASNFEDAGQDENLTIEFEARPNNKIGLLAKGIRASSGGVFGPLQTARNEELQWALTQYGLWLDISDPPDSPEVVTIAYPLQQRTGQVYITKSPFSVARQGDGASASVGLNPIVTPVSKLASEVVDVSEFNAVVVGGPCVNDVADVLMRKPEPCTLPFLNARENVTFFEHLNGNVALLVAGLSAGDTESAVKQLLSKQNFI
ncbi:MAG: hypothetical protein HY363_05315 [Candidatus Aenigmarchaeota archaeon]|nr:hypothetical protein [Candidatus Aenigmarchaeota archaeon]